jgi:uncharacterized protein (TIGR02679 family)
MKILERPAYRPLWDAARRRIEANGLSLDGSPLHLKGLAAEEADAIAGLLGIRRPPPGAPVRVSLAALDRCLRTSAVGRGLLEVLQELGGPLTDRRAHREADGAERALQWAGLATHPAVGNDERLPGWLSHVRSSGLARRLAGDDETQAMGIALDVLSLVNKDAVNHRLAVLAAVATGDAHGLDRGRPAGTLTVHALSWLAARPFPDDAADWRRSWAEAGVACDDLSCDVLVLNLPGWSREPLRLTLRQASAWRSPAGAPEAVFVCENPAVLAAAADQLGERAPTMLCLDGMPSTAALVVLDHLVAGGAVAHYHGDFDWRGLGIAGVLARKVPAAQSWRFGAPDYMAAVQRGLGTVPLSGRTTTSPWDVDLAPSMADAGVAVYEEQVLDQLVDDLASCAEGRSAQR